MVAELLRLSRDLEEAGYSEGAKVLKGTAIGLKNADLIPQNLQRVIEEKKRNFIVPEPPPASIRRNLNPQQVKDESSSNPPPDWLIPKGLTHKE